MAAPYIRRLDRAHNGTRGWEVHVTRRGLRVSRMFSDSRHGGSDGALAAAIHWRDQQDWYRNGSVQHRGASLLRADAFVNAVLLADAMRHGVGDEGEPAPPPPPEPGVLRVNGPLTERPGWMATAHRLRRFTHKFFADADWGDPRLAHAAAATWRELHMAGRQGLEALQPARVPRAPGAGRSQRRQQAEAVVHPPVRYEKTELGDGRRGHFAFWMAAWTDPQGVRWERKFSVNFWGEDEARRRAEAAHQVHMRRAAGAQP